MLEHGDPLHLPGTSRGAEEGFAVRCEGAACVYGGRDSRLEVLPQAWSSWSLLSGYVSLQHKSGSGRQHRRVQVSTVSRRANSSTHVAHPMPTGSVGQRATARWALRTARDRV